MEREGDEQCLSLVTVSGSQTDTIVSIYRGAIIAGFRVG
jgi:hypothetical protein